MVMIELDIGPSPENLPLKENILGVMVQYVKLVLKRSTTLPCSMLEKVLMDMGEVDIGL